MKPQLSPKECQFDSRKNTKNSVRINSETNEKFIVNCRNIWFNEFWSQHHKCTFDMATDVHKNLTKCTGDEDLSIGYEQEGLVPFVVDAVYAIAKAVDDIFREHCHSDYEDEEDDDSNEYSLCVKNLLSKLSGQQLLKYIHKVEFKGPQGTDIRFNEDGDAYGYYNIYQYQKHDSKYDYVPVGTWRERYNKFLYLFNFFPLANHFITCMGKILT